MNVGYEFVHDERLGIALPVLTHDWLLYSQEQQEAMIVRWEAIRARIPDRVKVLEEVIDRHQLAISQEDDWDQVVAHYEEVYRIASIINDLNIWMTIEQYTSESTEAAHVGIAEEHTTREK
ncbi:MAG: hypothetical protein ACXVDJ_08160 [Tumebacillaceae bacterium]